MFCRRPADYDVGFVADDVVMERGIVAGVVVEGVVGCVVEVGEGGLCLSWWWCINDRLALKVDPIC